MTQPAAAPLTDRRYTIPFVLITSLFFLWALGVNLNDILIPHFKKTFALNDFQSSFIQAAFFGGYFLAALPAGWLMSRIGYKRGILCGLFLCATGALLFIPSAKAGVYAFFLGALFLMACGQSFLEVAANPYITILGPPETAVRRLNLAQSFNAVGAVITPFLGAAFILSDTGHSAAELATMTAQQISAYRISEASAVRVPYLVIAGIFALAAFLIWITKLPEARATESPSTGAKSHVTVFDALRVRHLSLGVVAQFCYVGAQVGVASFIIRFAEHTLPGLSEKSAAHYLQAHLVGFMLGRFSGSAIMKIFPAPRLLALFAFSSIVCLLLVIFATGNIAVWAVVLIGFFHSIMFPTIFALGIDGLGDLTKVGSSLLVMAIIGGAIFPSAMGRISDASNIQIAFVIPLLCHVVVFYFALHGYKPVTANRASAPAPTA
jgi:FHS family L-fucose permease-like MFS transporter